MSNTNSISPGRVVGHFAGSVFGKKLDPERGLNTGTVIGKEVALRVCASIPFLGAHCCCTSHIPTLISGEEFVLGVQVSIRFLGAHCPDFWARIFRTLFLDSAEIMLAINNLPHMLGFLDDCFSILDCTLFPLENSLTGGNRLRVLAMNLSGRELVQQTGSPCLLRTILDL